MKKILIPFVLLFILIFNGCSKSDFEKAYLDPKLITNTTIEKQFAGMIYTNREYVVPSYWNYFVVNRITVNRFTQVVGWANATTQYVPGLGAINDRWNNYYLFLASYRELQKVYNALSPEEQAKKKIWMMAATVYFYDHTQKVVDVHGDIPWSTAGMLSTNEGDYQASFAKYDKAEDIYATMIGDLKNIANELNSLTLDPGVADLFKTQDIINGGDLTLWKKYCNSLRLRMLARVSASSSFANANAEMGEIVSNPSTYPVVSANSENILIDVTNLNSDINSKGFETGLEDWNGNIASKVMIDLMSTTNDPRIRAMFEPGQEAAGVYKGLDQNISSDEQTQLINSGTLSIYNRSTISRNDYFPGVLINAAEISFLIAEYKLKNGDDGGAKDAYNKGITESIEAYFAYRTLSNDNTAGDLVPLDNQEVVDYLAKPAVKWESAANNEAKLVLIATQKWLHYSVIQPMEGWSELRRLDAPTLTFWVDQADEQKQPPYRWFYAGSEKVHNTENYNAVAAKDNLTTKIFWDVK